MDRCYFAKEAPQIDLRGGLIFITPAGAHCEIAMAPATMVAFIRLGNEVLAKLRVAELERTSGNVIKMRGKHH